MRIKKCIRDLIFITLTLPSFLSQGAENDEREWIEKQRIDWNIPGVSVAIVRLDKTPEIYASGLCNIQRNISCTPNSQFQIGSITKFVTGVLASTLVAEQGLELDKPIQTDWKDFRLSDDRWTEVTLKDLLSGRSGIGSVDWPYFWDQSLTRKDYLKRLEYLPMTDSFRKRWSYSNTNFVIAGTYFEKLSGTPWEDLVDKYIFKRMDMKQSGFQLSDNQTTGYALDSQGHDIALPVTTTQAIGPAGSVVSTATDFSHFMQTILNRGVYDKKPVVVAKVIKKAIAPVIGLGYDSRFYGPPGGYGFGVFSATYHQTNILYHGGGYPGYTSFFALLPDQKLGVLVLTNRNNSAFPEALTLGLIDRALGFSGDETMQRWKNDQDYSTPSTATKYLANPTHPLIEYVGEYDNPAWGTFSISLKNDILSIKFGDYHVPLQHNRYDSFSFLSLQGWETLNIRFESNFDGDLSGFFLDDKETWFSKRE